MEQSEIRQGAHDMLAPGNVNEQLEDKISDRPLAGHLLELPVLFKAVAIAAVVTLISLILFSPVVAAVLLILTFFGSWVFLAHRDYERRRPTRPADEAEVKEGERISAH